LSPADLEYTSPTKFRFNQRLILGVVPPLASLYLRFVAATSKIVIVDGHWFQNVRRDPSHVIMPFWHESLLLAATY